MNKMGGFALRTGIIGLVLGLLGGIFGRVDFGTLLLRTLLSGLILAAAGGGLYFLISKFLPELLTISLKSADESPLDGGLGAELGSESGSNVNIVIDGNEENASLQNAGDQADDLRDEIHGVGAEASVSRGTGENDGAVNLRSESPSSVGNLFVEDESSIIEEVHEERTASQKQGSVNAPNISDDDFYSGVENLPDISGFSESFDDGSFSDDEEEVPEGETGPDSDMGSTLSDFNSGGTSNDVGSDDDPKVIAQAIRTLMKKE